MTGLRNSSWALVILLCCYCGLAGASFGKMIPLLSDIGATLAVSQLQVALLLSIVAAMAALLAPVAGWIGDRFGDRPLLLVGMVVLAAGSAIGAAVPGYAGLAVGRCTEGAGFIAMLTGTAALMMRTMQGPRQAAGMALFGASIPAGIGVGEALAGLVAGADWRYAFWGHCAALAAGVLALGLVPAWQRAPAQAHARMGALEIYRHASPLRLGAALGILTLAQFGVTSLFPTYLHAAFGISLGQAAVFGAAGLMASIVGSAGAGAVLSRGAPVRGLAIASFGSFGVLGAAIFAAPAGLAVCVAASIVFFVAGGFANGLILALLPRVLPDPALRGRAGGLVNQCSNLGILAAPPIAVALFAAHGAPGMAALVVATAILPLLIMPIAAASRQPRPAELANTQGI